eukprot:4797666-Prymnesium_polylepis.1
MSNAENVHALRPPGAAVRIRPAASGSLSVGMFASCELRRDVVYSGKPLASETAPFLARPL